MENIGTVVEQLQDEEQRIFILSGVAVAKVYPKEIHGASKEEDQYDTDRPDV